MQFRQHRMPPLDKLVLVMLTLYARSDGSHAFPSVGTLSSNCGLSEREVQRRLRRLTQAGYVEVQRRAGQHRPTCYRILPHRGDDTVTPQEAPEVTLPSPLVCGFDWPEVAARVV